jgi:hypothetical protein
MVSNTDPWFYVHGLDLACIVFGLTNCAVQKFRKNFFWHDQRSMIFELANGAAMPPIFILMIGSLGTSLLIYLAEHGNAVLIFIAGFSALLALVDASFGPPRPTST